jgi:membrane protein
MCKIVVPNSVFLNPKFFLTLFAGFIVYFYVYAPPFKAIPFGTDKPILLASMVYITYKKRWMNLYILFQKEFFFLFGIVFLSLFVSVIHRIDTSLLLYDILLLLECIPTSYFLFCIFRSWNLKHIDNIIIYTAIIGAIISTYLLINPELTYYIKTILLKYPEHLIDRFLYRGYGISDGLLFSYPVIQGFCFSFILINVGGKSNLFFKTSLLFLFVAVFSNARSGFVSICVAFILMLLYDKRSLFLRLLFPFLILLMLLSGTVSVLLEKNEMLNMSLEWAKTSLDIFSDFIKGEESENVSALLNDMIVLPSSIDEWLIGNGKNIFLDACNNSDIGYFIRLKYGGIIYLTVWIFFCIYMFKRLYKLNKGIALILFISLVYLNYKGDFFIVNPGSRFFFLIYSLIVIDSTLFLNSINKKTNS